MKQRILPAIVPVLCMVLFIIKAVTSMVQESSTFDETCYFGLGKYLLQHRRCDVPGSILHPPLSYVIHSIPLLFVPTDPTLWKSDPARATDPAYLGSSYILRGQALLSSPANQGDRLLTLSRLMMVLTAVLLGCFVYVWSYSLYGNGGATLAMLLFAFSPNILAHARLITPDITLTTFSFITLYYCWRLLSRQRIGDAVLGGLCLGLALLSKFTGLLLLPICLALMTLWRTSGKTLNGRHCLLFILLGVGILHAAYGMDLEPYLAGILRQEDRAAMSYHNFLMGHYSEKGWWYYFLAVFLIKTPIASIIFLMISMVLFLGRLAKGQWINEAFLLLPAAVLFCFFSLNAQAKGVRYILPIYPLLFVFAAKAAQWLLSNKARTAACVALMTWYVGASCWIHPHYLAYFNELVGGPDNGYQCLVDSNLDWGQDLKGLAKYMRQHGISKINLSFFGSDSPERYGISYTRLPSYYLRGGDPKQPDIALKGWVAISATNLQGAYFGNRDIFAWFRSRKPVAKIGYSILLYNLDG